VSGGRGQPNIVVVLADDMGWGDSGCYGASEIPTPHIDGLAAAGVRLTNCHSGSAVCTPSRYALVTGRYSWRGPLKNFVLMGHGPSLIETSRPTLGSVLGSAGYATGVFGKWHLGLGWRHRDGTVRDAFAPGARLHDDVSADSGADIDYAAAFTGGPVDLGFERFFGIAGSLDMPPYCFLDQDRTAGIPDRPKERFFAEQRPGLQVPEWREDEVDVRFVAEATRWIRQCRGRPFLAYLALSAPHRPCLPPEFVRGRSSAGARGDAVCLVDWAVGEIVATLDDLGVREDTLMIVTSDNGALTYFTDDTDGSAHQPNGDWRGQKGDIWDGGHREPFVACWPGRIPAGTVRGDPVCLTDVLPTAAAAAGARLAAGAAEDGQDILPVLLGTGSVDPDRPLVHHSLAGRFALRRGRWKAIFASDSGGGFSGPAIGSLFTSGTGAAPSPAPWDAEHPDGQLYDMAADPRETTNLWKSEPGLVAELYAELTGLCGDESSGLPADVRLGASGGPDR
jgi:arylsulfatase A